MPRISREKALGKIEEYLAKVDQMQTMLYDEGNELREDLNISIRTMIPLAFEDGEKKVKDFDDYVNWYVAAVGVRKSPNELHDDYQRRLRDTKKYLRAWKDELEIAEDLILDNTKKAATSHDPKKVFVVHGHYGAGDLANPIGTKTNHFAQDAR